MINSGSPAGDGEDSRTNVSARILLVTVCAASVLLSVALLVSFFGNNSLEGDVLAAAEGVSSGEARGGEAGANELPSADTLTRLDHLRESVATLAYYQRHGAPLSLGWGLYTGNAMLPGARRLYFDKFNQLLLSATQKNLASILAGLPPAAAPGGDYQYAYDTLKSYLITTSCHEKSTKNWLAPVLLNRWLRGRTIDSARLDLARRQFAFYADELRTANPYPADSDKSVIEHARAYFAESGGAESANRLIDDCRRNAPSRAGRVRKMIAE